MDGFFLGLRAAGFAEGRDVKVEQRWADGNYDRVREMAADLASRRLNVIFASGNPAAIELKKITSTIPVVFTIGLDPVKYAFAANMNQARRQHDRHGSLFQRSHHQAHGDAEGAKSFRHSFCVPGQSQKPQRGRRPRRP